MVKEIESPKINEAQERLAEVAIIEVSNIRLKDLIRNSLEHAEKNKQLLKEAITHLIRLNIFPTVEIITPGSENFSGIFQEKLLFVANFASHSEFSTDYFVNPNGELLSYLKVGEQTVQKTPATNGEYIAQTDNALLAIEHRIQDSMMGNKPRFRMIKGGAPIEEIPLE